MNTRRNSYTVWKSYRDASAQSDRTAYPGLAHPMSEAEQPTYSQATIHTRIAYPFFFPSTSLLFRRVSGILACSFRYRSLGSLQPNSIPDPVPSSKRFHMWPASRMPRPRGRADDTPPWPANKDKLCVAASALFRNRCPWLLTQRNIAACKRTSVARGAATIARSLRLSGAYVILST